MPLARHWLLPGASLNVQGAGNTFGLVATRLRFTGAIRDNGQTVSCRHGCVQWCQSALLAQSGFGSRPDTLEADQGFAVTHAAEMRVADEILDGVAQCWMFEAVLHSFMRVATVRASLEALIEARDSLGVEPDEVANVSRYHHGICRSAISLNPKRGSKPSSATVCVPRWFSQAETLPL